jgi:hypothetical protein
MVQDESVGFVQGTAFRSGNHCALRALVSQIQTELSGLGPNDGGTRNCADSHDDSLRWVQRFVPEFEKRWSQYSRPVGRSWRCDETYIKVKGRWTYRFCCEV